MKVIFGMLLCLLLTSCAAEPAATTQEPAPTATETPVPTPTPVSPPIIRIGNGSIVKDRLTGTKGLIIGTACPGGYTLCNYDDVTFTVRFIGWQTTVQCKPFELEEYVEK